VCESVLKRERERMGERERGRERESEREHLLSAENLPEQKRHFFIDNLLVRIHFIFVMNRWTGLAPWEFEFLFPGSLTSTSLGEGGRERFINTIERERERERARARQKDKVRYSHHALANRIWAF